jgi:hypothetical protein
MKQAISDIINGDIDFNNSMDDNDKYFQYGTITFVVKFPEKEKN